MLTKKIMFSAVACNFVFLYLYHFTHFLYFEFVMRFPMYFRWCAILVAGGCMFAQFLDCVCFGGNKLKCLLPLAANISYFQKHISSISTKIFVLALFLFYANKQ